MQMIHFATDSAASSASKKPRASAWARGGMSLWEREGRSGSSPPIHCRLSNASVPKGPQAFGAALNQNSQLIRINSNLFSFLSPALPIPLANRADNAPIRSRLGERHAQKLRVSKLNNLLRSVGP